MMLERTLVVRWSHCDAAGIMFYPQQFALISDMVEDWMAALGTSFKQIHVDHGKAIPTVRFETDFTRVCRLGDALRQTLQVQAIGRASVTLKHEMFAQGEIAARFIQTLAHIDLKRTKAEAWPDDLRAKMQAYAEAE